MSDEMVQEQAEAPPPAPPEDGHGVQEGAAMSQPVSPSAHPAAVAEEPAPAEIAAPVHEEAPIAAEPAPAQTSASAAPPRSGGQADSFDAEMLSQYDQALRPMQEGDVITGTVMRVDREGVLVDVGAKSEGIIRVNELSRDSNISPEAVVKVGDQIKVYVLEPENQDGNPILSKKRADFEQAWERVQQAKESGETLVAMVTDRVKGGLVVDLGIRGFVPASHVGNGNMKTNLDRYVGQTLPLKVIEVDKERRKVVLSNKLAADEDRRARSEETRANLQPGKVVHGVVRRLTNYGAFVDLGGIDGLLHISEMSWTRINDPREVLREGQEIDVIILKMDLTQNRVSLGLRQILPDPWTEISSRYKEGDVIPGTVTRIVPFGAFVQVEGGVEGIIPNSEMARRGRGPVAQGEEVEVKVIALRPDERKMTLSMRALSGEEREAAPAREGAPPREPRRRGREGDDREDYSRYAPGRQEEPRFTIGDAFAAAQRRERPKRDRRAAEEEVDYLDDLEAEQDLEPEQEQELEQEVEQEQEVEPEQGTAEE